MIKVIYIIRNRYGARTPLLPGDTPKYAKPKNRNTADSMDIGLFICVSLFILIIFPNSLTVSALIIAKRIEKETGPPRIHPTNTATNTIPVNVLNIKLFFMIFYGINAKIFLYLCAKIKKIIESMTNLLKNGLRF